MKMINKYIQNRIEEIAGNKWDFEGIEHNGTAAFLIIDQESDHHGRFFDIKPKGEVEIYNIAYDESCKSETRLIEEASRIWLKENSEDVARVQELLKIKEASTPDFTETEKKLTDLISDMEFNLSRAKEIKREVENG